MKRFWCVVMIVAMMVPLLAQASFTDVPEDHEHYAAILWMEGRGVIQGYEDGTFRPDQEVNRAEALKIILMGSGIDVPEVIGFDETVFRDVDLEDWFVDYVIQANAMEIIQGYDDGYFRPEQTINLAETLKIISLTRGVEADVPTDDPYVDVAADAWFASYVDYCKERNFIEAQDDGYLHPDYAVTRGDLTEIMYRFSYVESFDTTVFPIALNWTTYQHDTDDFAFKVPYGWEVISGSNGEIVLWHQDVENGQKLWDRTTPNSAVVTIHMDWTPGDDYFNDVAAGLEGYAGVTTETTTTATADDYLSLLVSYEGDQEAFRDLYITMPEGILVVQGTYGTGLLKDQLNEYVTEIGLNIYYAVSPEEPVEPEPDPEEVVEQARLNIQVDGEGQATLDLFSDLELIETDTIGVGTGPVDYYYSAWADVTLKYERSFDVILDVENGQTSAF